MLAIALREHTPQLVAAVIGTAGLIVGSVR
jgi:hypothetical protein